VATATKVLAVLQKALDTLSLNDDVRVLYERGGAYWISRSTVLDCRRVAVPDEPTRRIWTAGLQPPRATASRPQPGSTPRRPASALADRRLPNSRAARDIVWEAPG